MPGMEKKATKNQIDSQTPPALFGWKPVVATKKQNHATIAIETERKKKTKKKLFKT